MKIYILLSISALLVFFSNESLYAQSEKKDTIDAEPPEKYDQFYDSLKYKANQNKITKLIYDFLITSPRPYVDEKALALDYYSSMEGKIISDITINSLDVFGPTLQDTSRKARSWLEKSANSIHTKSNLNTIEKMLLFEVGDFVDPELLYENERLIRSLPYIKDIRFILEQDTIYTGLVRLHVITKDRFSLGVSGALNGSSSAALEVYNQNIFGVGHEISFGFVGSLNKQPYTGLETFYKISNIRGKFVDISAGYMNTYKREGFSFLLNKPFITPSIRWGYGASALRMYRTDRIFDDDPITTLLPLNLAFISAWGGRSFQLNQNALNNSQMVFTAGFFNRKYYQRPTPEPEDNQYFSNSTFYLAGLTFTQRRYVQDQLVYSYGITEDIPEGFKNEIVYGFDANEFGDRHYAHIFLSNGNLLANKKGYLYIAGGLGGYFRGFNYEQGQIQGSLNFISKQVTAGRKRFRLFARSNYIIGLNRFDIESVNLRRHDYIRGFSSRTATGKQRLSLDLEYVLFLRKEFYKFNMALFGFGDFGFIGSNKQFILTEDFYTGIGFGMRLHNENLVFRTLQLRLAFYPFHPNDMGLVGFILNEQQKEDFYSF
ncbi:MAG TPA: hypothetical protein VKA10_01660, partial [Prolixibacteraceae bacterium]|nr:hypothetical protein [Prolixibacteraceae bacterium]